MSSCTSTTSGACPSAGGTPSTGTAPRATSACTRTRRSAAWSARTTTEGSASSVRLSSLLRMRPSLYACGVLMCYWLGRCALCIQARPAHENMCDGWHVNYISPASAHSDPTAPAASTLPPPPLPRLSPTNASPSHPAPNRASRLPRHTTRPNRRRCATSGRRRQDTVGMRTSTAAAAATSPGPTRPGSGAPAGPQGQDGTWRTWCATRCVVCHGADRQRRGGWADDVRVVRGEGPLRQPLPPSCAQTVQAVREGWERTSGYGSFVSVHCVGSCACILFCLSP